jgi:diguanylate cyclase (GGDEF)-like protein
VLPALPFVIGAMVLLLAARFRRSRLAAAGILVMAAAWVLSGDGPVPRWAAATALVAVPPGLALVALLADHPLFSPRGLAQLLPAVLLLACCGTAVLLAAGGGTVPVWPEQAVWALVLAAFVVSLASYIFRRGVVDAAFLPALAAVALAVAEVHAGHGGTAALAAAQGVFLVAGAEEAYRLAFQDELTGLPGRRAFEEAIRRLRGTYAMAMVDIDRFKDFNDRYGHDAGDQVLCMVARELGRVPAGGRPFRYGGEEFVVLFPGAGREAAVSATEAVREAIARRRFHRRGPDRPRRRPRKPRPAAGATVSLSISAGVAASGPERRHPRQVLLAADAALYRAKGNGRNRVEAADGGNKKPDRAVRGKMNGDT